MASGNKIQNYVIPLCESERDHSYLCVFGMVWYGSACFDTLQSFFFIHFCISVCCQSIFFVWDGMKSFISLDEKKL